MKAIVIAFTLKNQDFEKIATVLQRIQNEEKPDLVIHGFMTRAAVLEKGFNTDVVDLLDSLFSRQRIFFKDGKPLRSEMVECAIEKNATVHVIGEIKEGVEEEVNLYLKHSVQVFQYGLDNEERLGFIVGDVAVDNKISSSNTSLESTPKNTTTILETSEPFSNNVIPVSDPTGLSILEINEDLPTAPYDPSLHQKPHDADIDNHVSLDAKRKLDDKPTEGI